MSPYSRFAWTLGISLMLWLPVAFVMLAGGIEVSTGGLYYVASLGLTWIGMGIFSQISEGYRRSAERVNTAKRQIEAMERRAAARPVRRRVSDRRETESSEDADDADD